MSTVTYKHTLRRHVPSSPSPSPPGTPSKSSTASIHSHHSKREKVKGAVDHLLHKFHIPHHHHHHHEHEQSDQSGRQSLVTPEKKSFLVKRASRTSSLKGKSSAATVDVPFLGYKRSPSSSSSSSLEETQPSTNDQEHQTIAQPQDAPPPAVIGSSPSAVVNEPAPQLGVGSSAQCPPVAEVVSSVSALAQTSVEFVTEAHRYSQREEVEEAVDLLFHKFHIPHHHHDHEHSSQAVAEFASATETSVSSPAEMALSETPVLVEERLGEVHSTATAEVLALEATEGQATETVEGSKSTQEVTTTSDPLLTVESTPSPLIVVTEAEPELEDHLSRQDETRESNSEEVDEVTIAKTEPMDEAALVTEVTATASPKYPPSGLIASKVVVDSTIQTDHLIDIPPSDAPTANEESLTTTLTNPTPSPVLSFPLPPTSRRDAYPLAVVPFYNELRKATAASNRHSRTGVRDHSSLRPASSFSWWRYIFSRVVRPVAVIAVECTIATVCFGLVKVLEAMPRRPVASGSIAL
ncbi:hypothetical protein BC835DRAFT_202379 [Cytidiella melzeri]|nr:hypothetical protein BC835DRAFT_202379 [Cytidiella melzeri]